MKKISIIVIGLICCAFLLGSCKQEDNTGVPTDENDTGEEIVNGNGSPDSSTKNGDNKIQTGDPAETATPSEENGDDPEVAGATPEDDGTPVEGEESMPVEEEETYYTILNDSDDSSLLISFLDSSANPITIALEENNCVKVTEAQFQDDIFEIIHIFNEEETPFCGTCSDCTECVANNYKVIDAFWWGSDDYIKQMDRSSMRVVCVPLLQFAPDFQ